MEHLDNETPSGEDGGFSIQAYFDKASDDEFDRLVEEVRTRNADLKERLTESMRRVFEEEGMGKIGGGEGGVADLEPDPVFHAMAAMREQFGL